MEVYPGEVRSPRAANSVFTLPLVGRVGAKRRGGVGVGGRDSVLQLRPPPPTPTPTPSHKREGSRPSGWPGKGTTHTRSSGAGQPSLTSPSPIHRFRALSPRAETKTSRPARE